MDYITVVKGDDTNFVDDQFIIINFDSEIDFTGFKAKFKIGDITLDYDDISSKKINVILSNEVTSALEVGKQYADLKIIDSQDRTRTVTSVIPIKVIDIVNTSPTYVNNVLEIKTEVNTSEITIKIETSGISLSEAQLMMSQCEAYKQQSQNYALSCQNYSNSASQSATNSYNSASASELSAQRADNKADFCELQVTGFDTHVAGKQADFDSNATSKTNAFNGNSTSKTEAFNNNATSKTDDFNSNYNTKKTAIDNVATQASNSATQARQFAVGLPSEPSGGSAKHWAEEAERIVSQGQVQADWLQSDNTKKDYIKNKPTIPTVPTDVSAFNNDAGYLTSHQDISGKEDVAKAMNVLETSGTIALTDNSVNTITPTGNVTFTLPTVTDNTKFHQIFVQMNMPTTAYTIDMGLGTPPHWLIEEEPDLSSTGNYNLYWEYDKANQYWKGGALKEGVGS